MSLHSINTQVRSHARFYQDIAWKSNSSETHDEPALSRNVNIIEELSTICANSIALDDASEIEAASPSFSKVLQSEQKKLARVSRAELRDDALALFEGLPSNVRDSFPIEVKFITCAVQTSGCFWFGSNQGAVRWRESEGWRYFAGERWLPDDSVASIASYHENSICILTETGATLFRSVLITLDEKAAEYEAQIKSRHNRMGFVATCVLENPDDLRTSIHEATDNDGLWTALYVWAEALRYSVTGELEAKENAMSSVRALLRLVSVTGISGFPARAIILEDERVRQSDPGPNWYPSPVELGVFYKNDTSSDEIAAHFLAWYVASEFVATPDEKAAVAEVCRSVMNHILDNDFMLVGPTGKRTSWGVWNPKFLNDDAEWRWERGLNSLEILSHLKVAIRLCGDSRFEEAYQSLVAEYGYANNTLEQKVVPPFAENNHSDDELAACAYYPLLILETDSTLKDIYLRSLERTQEILRPEGSPFYNFLYTACTGKPCDEEASWRFLRETPLDLRHWNVTNSHRKDIKIQMEPDRFHRPQTKKTLSPAERYLHKWNSNPFRADGGDTGKTEEDGTFWLLAYWLGRRR